MSVSGIFSSNQVHTAYRLTNSQFQQLGQDLAQGNLSAAQSDFAMLEQAFTQPATVSSSSTSNPVAQAFKELASDLKSSNLSGAQQDYSTIQEDLQNLSCSRQLHNHHRSNVARQAYATMHDLSDLTQAGSTIPPRNHSIEPPMYKPPIEPPTYRAPVSFVA